MGPPYRSPIVVFIAPLDHSLPLRFISIRNLLQIYNKFRIEPNPYSILSLIISMFLKPTRHTGLKATIALCNYMQKHNKVFA